MEKTMKLSRRQFVKSSAASLLATTMGARISVAGEAGVRRDQLPTKQDVWSNLQFMNDLGLRYSGSSNHQKYVQFLEDRFRSFGLEVDSIPHTSVLRWDLVRSELKIGGDSLPVASCGRFCATTGSDGVTGQLVHCGLIEGPSGFGAPVTPDVPRSSITLQPGSLDGKVAFFEISATPMPLGKMFEGHVRQLYNSERTESFPQAEATTAAFGAAQLPDHQNTNLHQSGAIGVIYAWANLSDDSASGQLRQGGGGLPTLWVSGSAAKRLKAEAGLGSRVTMRIEADSAPNTPTRTLLATLPGSSTDEVIILWTHSDGMNAIEENGGIAIVNMLNYFSSLPKSSRARTIVTVVSEAHFAEQYVPTSAWIKEKPDLVSKAVADVAIEHLGCREWIDDPAANVYQASGRPELAFAFCTTESLANVMADSLQDTKSGRVAVIDTDVHAFSPGLSGYRLGKIPMIGYISTPAYLLAAGKNGHIEKLDPDLFHEQMFALTRAVRRVDRMSRTELQS
jgi:hypothetical protein